MLRVAYSFFLLLIAASLSAQPIPYRSVAKRQKVDQMAARVIAPHVACANQPVAYTCGATKNDSLTSGSCSTQSNGSTYFFDGYQLIVTQTTNIDMTLRGTGFDALLGIIDTSDNSIVADDDDSGGGTDARIRTTLFSGTYLVIVTTVFAQETGSYSLSSSCSSGSSCTVGAITCGGSVTDTLRTSSCLLSDGTQYMIYAFEGQAGQQVDATMTSSAFDSYLFLVDPSFGDIAQDDDSGGGENARVQATLTVSGTHYLIANSFAAGGLGEFNLSLTCTTGGGGGGACTPGTNTLCLDDQPGDRRYKVEVAYQTSQGGGQSGMGKAVQTNSLGITRGGLFWFFAPDNPELLIKVLNGCTITNRHWVYFSAGTNVGMTITVTDTTTNEQKIYTNPDLTPAVPVQDTQALGCP